MAGRCLEALALSPGLAGPRARASRHDARGGTGLRRSSLTAVLCYCPGTNTGQGDLPESFRFRQVARSIFGGVSLILLELPRQVGAVQGRLLDLVRAHADLLGEMRAQLRLFAAVKNRIVAAFLRLIALRQ